MAVGRGNFRCHHLGQAFADVLEAGVVTRHAEISDGQTRRSGKNAGGKAE